MANFPGLATTAITTLESGDVLLVGDSSNSDRATEIDVENFLMPVPYDSAASTLGRNHIVSPDSNSITANVHHGLILNATNSSIDDQTHPNRGTDPDWVSGAAEHAVIIGYDSRVNAIAGVCISKHGDIQGNAGHGTIIGGSFAQMTGGSEYSIIGGGTSNVMDDSEHAVIMASESANMSASDGAVILGGEGTTHDITSSIGAALIAGDNNQISSAAFSSILGSQNCNITGGTNGAIIGCVGGSVTGNNGVLIGCPVSGTSVAAVGAVILGGQIGASTIDSASASSFIAGGRNNSIEGAPYSMMMGQDGVAQIRAAFHQSADSISADGDAQRVTWVGRGSGSGTVNLPNTGSNDSSQEFGDYGTTGGIWIGTITIGYRRDGNYGRLVGRVAVSWPAGGTAVIEYQDWESTDFNEDSVVPSIAVSSNGGWMARIAAATATTQAVALYDGIMTHW